MATYNPINDWVDYAVEGVNLSTDQIILALSNTAPASEASDPTTDGNGILANVTEIAYTNLSTRNVTTSSSSQTAGTYSLVLADLTLTSSGGSTGPFQYIYVYDSTVSGSPIISYYDYGSELTLGDGETLDVDFSASGLFTLTVA